MTAPQVTPYDVCGPLPAGTVLLEASAGTGKTFTIAALAARIVAEGHAELSQLMLVTFSRAATAELRERVRERLVSAHRGLLDPPAARGQADDTVLALLASADDAEVALRRERLARALSAFDAATIATTHGFCQQMLAGLGVAADTDPAASLTESVADLVGEVVDDLYIRKYALRDDGVTPIGRKCAGDVAAKAVFDPFARLEPADAPRDSEAQQRFGIAAAARAEVERRKRARHLFTYDDLLLRLHQALHDPATGSTACARIRARYRYVLVDEFQDTDPVQWAILRTAFLGHTTLVLIGDPKQAIYAFRGADVFAYLKAYDEATTHHTLARNWRSDAVLLSALDRVYGGAALGEERITVRPVQAQHQGRRLAGAHVDAPLRVRALRTGDFDVEPGKKPPVGQVRQAVAADAAADIARLLASGATLDLPGRNDPKVMPGDIAVLVRTHDQASSVREQLRALGIPAVLTGAKSVFLTAPAKEWLAFLRALEQPHRSGLARAAALTSFVGWSAERLALATDVDADELGLRLRRWRDLLAQRGVAALLEVVTTETDLMARLLSQVNGERDLTDLRHVGQALHAAARSEGLGPTALVEWLSRQIADAGDDSSEERSRRLESDADAVQIATIHVSKGLEFPIVYVPFAWDRHVFPSPDPATFHDPAGERVLYVGGSDGPGYVDARDAHQREAAGEELRLFYVAATRAQCRVVTWWASAYTTPGSALHRLLFGERGLDGSVPPTVVVEKDATCTKLLSAWAGAAGDAVSLEWYADAAGPAPAYVPPAAAGSAPLAASFDRSLDTAWRRASYSSLTAAVHESAAFDAGVASEPEVDERRDEPAVPPPDDAVPGGRVVPGGDEAALRAVPSPMADLPTGAAFGTVVHAVFEEVDTSVGADGLLPELQARCGDALAERLATTATAEQLAAALLPVMRTPLGPLAGGRSLADIAPADRLAELEFELPLLGGDRPRDATASVRDIAALLRSHLDAADPLAAYADALAAPELARQALRGYLTGSIDAVLRGRDGDGVPRYLIVDYKTNWLGTYGPAGPDPLTAWDYRPAAMATAMIGAHYPLQALLYAVALHRYLRWRQPAYDPAVHLGGVLYLFVRGMCGLQTPVVDGVPTGVFSWRPPVALVEDLSRLLDRGAAA